MPQSTIFVQENLRKSYEISNRLTEDRKSYRAITIEDHRPDRVFQFFRNLENFSRFISGIKAVTVLSFTRSRLLAQLKSGLQTQWEVEIIEEIPGMMLAWKSIPDALVSFSGTVWFTRSARGKGTIVTMTMDYDLPTGRNSELAPFFNGDDPEFLVISNLHRLKAYLETGEIPTIEGQSSGREQLTHEFLNTRH